MTGFDTERLRLRRYTLADEAGVLEMFADEYARRFYPHMGEAAKARAWIEWNLCNYAQYGFGLWAVEVKTTGEFAGDCGLTYQDVDGRSELEIGYHVVLPHRGKGYATEAARACLDFGFRRTECASICSIVRPANAASCEVAGRIHSSRREFLKDGSAALLFYTLRGQWEGGAVTPA